MNNDICPDCGTAETMLVGKRMVCRRCYEVGDAEFEYLKAVNRLKELSK